jgi:hypothetical protein
MKHLETVNEWFGRPKEGDEFAKQLINIIERENIEIYSYYFVVVDDIKYRFYTDYDEIFPDYYLLIYNTKEVESTLEISRKYYDFIQKLSIKRNTKKLPDISDTGRMMKKFNI